MEKNQIPRIIHYCWFGKNKKNRKVQQCIASWKKFFPDYEIREWNETNTDISTNIYVKEAYHNKKYAFVSDVVRLQILYQYGGIYFDTDVQVVSDMRPYLLGAELVCGFESNEKLATCFLAAKKQHNIINEILLYYNDRRFIKLDGSLDLTANPAIWTSAFLKYGLICNGAFQKIQAGIKIYPSDYFCAFNGEKLAYEISDHTCCIHHCSASWLSPKEKRMLFLKRKISHIIGGERYDSIKHHIGK